MHVMDISMQLQQTRQNYDTAVTYYAARRKKFETLWNTKYAQSLSTIADTEMQSFLTAFNKFSDKVIKSIKIDPNGNVKSIGGVSEFNFNKKKYYTGLKKEELIGLNVADVKRKIAIPFEKTLSQFFSKAQLIAEKEVERFIVKHTGDIVQQGASFGGASKMIRSDFTVGNVKEIPSNMELSIELDNLIAQSMGDYAQIENIMTQAGYLSEDRFIGGFSVKNYSENISYTSSKVYMKMVNDELQNIYSAERANITVRFVLSKHIIAITSPTVVALITNKGLNWMDDILKDNQYIMHLRRHGQTGNFFVGNSNIYFSKNSNLYDAINNTQTIKWTTWVRGKQVRNKEGHYISISTSKRFS